MQRLRMRAFRKAVAAVATRKGNALHARHTAYWLIISKFVGTDWRRAVAERMHTVN